MSKAESAIPGDRNGMGSAMGVGWSGPFLENDVVKIIKIWSQWAPLFVA